MRVIKVEEKSHEEHKTAENICSSILIGFGLERLSSKPPSYDKILYKTCMYQQFVDSLNVKQGMVDGEGARHQFGRN